MIDTEDLSSYYPGYDDYCEPKDDKQIYDNIDELHDEFMIRKGIQNMQREIIDLDCTSLTIDEIEKLDNYVWTDNKLIPVELLDGE